MRSCHLFQYPTIVRIAACAGFALTLSAAAMAQVGDTAAGEKIAREGVPPQVAACISCHGAQGQGSELFPPLAGSGKAYLAAQLDAFASGARKQLVMEPIAAALTPEQRASVTSWFASLPPPIKIVKEAPAQSTDRGAWLATRGRWDAQVPACAQCHGPSGVGTPPHFPPIGALPAAYMQAQVDAWKAGTRPPGPLGLMEGIAKQLSTEDVSAVAAYYAKLHEAPASGKVQP